MLRLHYVRRVTARGVAGRFVVSYFLADDSLSVFEPPRRNSGIPGGRTADRGRVRRPDKGPVDYYGPGDMRLGECIHARL